MEVFRKDVDAKLQKLSAYAQEGKWLNVLEFAGHYKVAAAAAQNSFPANTKEQGTDELQEMLQEEFDAELAFTTFKVQALMRLRKFSAAGDELAQLGDLPEQQLAGAGPSACIPFGLLYLRAQLPACLGSTSLTLDLLYELRSYCQQRLQQAQQHQQLAASQKQAAAKGTQQQQQQEQHANGPDLQQHDQDQQQQQQQQQQQERNSPVRQQAAVAVWQLRLRGVNCSLICHHWQQGSVIAAFTLLDQLLLVHPVDIQLWSLAGRLQLQLSLLPQAHKSFSTVQRLVVQQRQAIVKNSDVQAITLQQLVHHNWGCYYALSNNMAGALREFTTAQLATSAAATAAAAASSDAAAAAASAASDPLAAAAADAGGDGTAAVVAIDAVSCANAAVCLLHMGQLTEAMSALEAGLHQHAAVMAQECFLFNLGLMYDLACRDTAAKQARHHVANCALRVMPDDFDLACIEPAKPAKP